MFEETKINEKEAHFKKNSEKLLFRSRPAEPPQEPPKEPPIQPTLEPLTCPPTELPIQPPSRPPLPASAEDLTDPIFSIRSKKSLQKEDSKSTIDFLVKF